MRSGMLLAAALFCLMPCECFALVFFGGKEPHDARHYPDWPGIVDVANNPSRIRYCWCNGRVTHWFQGDSAALQDAVREFAEVEASKLHLVLLPGPEQSMTYHGSDVRYNWSLNIPRNSDETVDPDMCPWEVHPTLTVYLSDELSLDSLTVPDGIVVQQWQDLREQYEHEISLNLRYRRSRAERRLQELEEDADREGDAARRFREQLAEIDAWIERSRREPQSR